MIITKQEIFAFMEENQAEFFPNNSLAEIKNYMEKIFLLKEENNAEDIQAKADVLCRQIIREEIVVKECQYYVINLMDILSNNTNKAEENNHNITKKEIYNYFIKNQTEFFPETSIIAVWDFVNTLYNIKPDNSSQTLLIKEKIFLNELQRNRFFPPNYWYSGTISDADKFHAIIVVELCINEAFYINHDSFNDNANTLEDIRKEAEKLWVNV